MQLPWAIQDLDQAIRLKPDDADAFLVRAHLYEVKEEFDRAIQDFEQAIRLKPDDAKPFNEAAWLCATAKDPQRAIPDRRSNTQERLSN